MEFRGKPVYRVPFGTGYFGPDIVSKSVSTYCLEVLVNLINNRKKTPKIQTFVTVHLQPNAIFFLIYSLIFCIIKVMEKEQTENERKYLIRADDLGENNLT